MQYLAYILYTRSQMMVKIITTADDYAMSMGVNSAIIECINLGILTSTNVMVNMPCLDDELKNYKNKISIGIHFNLTAGKSISDPKDIYTLVSDDGYFYSYDLFKQKVNKGLIKTEHIQRELIAQLNKFISFFGFSPIYWNTHQNIVLIRKAMNCIFKVAEKYNIKYTRTFCRAYLDYNSIHGKRKIRELLVKNYIRYLYNFKFSKNILKTDYRSIVFNRKNKSNLSLLQKMILTCGRNKSIEIVYHPSKLLDSSYFGTIGNERIDEYFYLKNNSIKILDIFNKCNAKLITYNDL